MSKLKMIIAATFMLGVSVALADKLSDFKDAVREDGCKSIPYSDLKSNCQSESSHVHEYCDGSRGPVTCGSENITRQLKDRVEKEKKGVEELKEKKSKLESEKSGAADDNEKKRLEKEIEQVEKDIYEAGKRVDQAIAELETRKKLVDDAIYTIGKCMDYRRAVMNVFGYALDKVRSENETPELQELGRKLRDKYEAEKRGHEIAITEKDNALNTCKSSRP